MDRRILLDDLIDQTSVCMRDKLKLSLRTVYGESYGYMKVIRDYCLAHGEKYYNPILLNEFRQELLFLQMAKNSYVQHKSGIPFLRSRKAVLFISFENSHLDPLIRSLMNFLCIVMCYFLFLNFSIALTSKEQISPTTAKVITPAGTIISICTHPH